MNRNERLNIPKLGFGLMRLPMKDGAIDMTQLNKMVDAFLENGFRYFDTAYVYHGGKSETALKAALTDRHPRESFLLADKLPAWVLKENADVQKVFDEQLERTGAGYFDFYLLHSMEAGHLPVYDRFGCWEWAQEMKKKGLIRHFGFSFHDSPELLEKILSDHPEVEFVQLQVNYLDWKSGSVQSQKCYETVRRHGLPVIVMEPVKGGSLAELRPELEEKMKAAAPGKSVASWAVRFSAQLEGILVVLSGMSDMAQMRDNLDTVKNLSPFTAREKACLEEVTEKLLGAPSIGCTACRYCVDGCPKQIKIPDIIREYNSVLTYGEHQRQHDAYSEIAAGGHGADACIRCGQCESVCPQHLAVTGILEKASAVFDEK